MEYVSGNVFIRRSVPARMVKDQVIVGHLHNFDHTTLVLGAPIEVSLLDVTRVNADGNPVDAQVARSRIISPEDEQPWELILKGRWHMLRALEDGASYLCVYAHQFPQALSIGQQGQFPQAPYLRTDPDGTQWVRVDPKVVQVTSGWADAYR